jgi:tRNA-dihydrouridine synthase
MKLLTLNFLTCARKACKQEPAAFPLHPRDAELERVEQEVNPEFLVNVLPRLDWKAIRSLSEEVSFHPIITILNPPYPASSQLCSTACLKKQE